MYIYKITNNINGKVYVGQSKLGGKNPNSSAIYCIDITTNSKTYYSSMKECQDAMDIPRHDIIRRRCTGTITKPYRNIYMFEYANKGVSTIESIPATGM